jgi:uncharacterized protein YPO0396
VKKLKKILLINWLYFSKELIDVDDINFLTGKNGAGKSTVIDALQIVLLGETNARNFNQAANEKSQRTLDGYLRADMDENNPNSRRGKDFSSFIVCEFWDDVEGRQFVCGVVFDCRSDGSRQDRFFLYDGTIPEDCFIRQGEAIDIPTLRSFLNAYGVRAKIYDTHKQYQADLLAKWNVHNEQVMRMMKKAVSFRPIVDIQKFITENICDIPEKPDIEAMQQNIRDYKRHEQLAQRQEEKLAALREIGRLYRDWQQAIDRWRIHSFLSLWAQKEVQQSQIDRMELEKRDCERNLSETEQHIGAIAAKIMHKETRQRELNRAVDQSSVFQEEEKLHRQKETLLREQKKLMEGLQSRALDIRRETDRISHLCEGISALDGDESLIPVREAAGTAHKAYAAFKVAGYELFACPLSLFETAQDAIAGLSAAMRNAARRVEDRLNIYKTEADQKQAALASLRKNIKDYPRGLLAFQKCLATELEQRLGRPAELPILADVLEIAEEPWRGAVEGYLNTQKFYLLVDPSCYREALGIYDRIKRDFGNSSFGIVDVGKLREREKLEPRSDSLAAKVETENALARSYIDYLLGRVICCAHAEQLRNYKTAITVEGMLYQGYVARPLRRELMEDVFIGRRAVELRIQRLESELKQTEAMIQQLAPVLQVLSRQSEPLFTQYFVQSTVQENLQDYLRGLEITTEVAKIDEQLSQLDLLWLNEQRRTIERLDQEIKDLRNQKDQKSISLGQMKEQIRQLEYERLPEQYQQLSSLEDRLQEDFSQEYLEQTGLPRYQQELARLKRPATVYKNFSDQLIRTSNEQEQLQKRLFQTRLDYADRFKPCSFRVDAPDNTEYEAEQCVLEESELPQYREKIKAARESAMEQFQNDFLAKLKSSIDQVREQVRSLNKALKQAQFGTDQYQFRVDRNPDYANYYDMIMAPELMEGEGGLFALPFQQKYGKLIETLFSQIAMSDDTQLNARKQSELQQNIERFTDFRTYLKFDLETTDQNGSKQLLSQTLNTKSGGETQTPFYIAVLASFAQLYQVNNPSSLASNTVRLVVFDEAFNKMDSDRIVESVHLLRKMGLQAIICTPPDKLPDIMPLADRTHLVIKGKYQMHIRAWGKEILPL